jgi:hypothetical protein
MFGGLGDIERRKFSSWENLLVEADPFSEILRIGFLDSRCLGVGRYRAEEIFESGESSR